MKVISQLIRHFWQSGSLSSDDVEYLLRHGFARQKDFPGYKPRKGQRLPPAPPEHEKEVEAPGHLEHLEETFMRRAASSRRGRANPAAKDITIKEICRQVRKRFEMRAEALSSVVMLAGSRSAKTTWQQSLGTLRGTEPKRLEQLLMGCLKRGSACIEDLWRALDPEPFVLMAHDPTWKGGSASAFSALMTASDPNALGRYKWILKHCEMCDLANLLVVWRRLLLAFGNVYRDNRTLLTRSLKNIHDPVVVWSFVLLYNATYLHDPDNRDGRREYGPLDLPSHAVWRSAWNCALMMDSGTVSPYLAACYSVQSPEADPLETCQCPLMCPVAWRVPGEKRLLSRTNVY